jgi:hypothetical protein
MVLKLDSKIPIAVLRQFHNRVTVYVTALLVMFVLVAHASEYRGSFKFKKMSVSGALAVYQELSEKKLVIDPAATHQSKTITLLVVNVPKKKAIQMIETALLEQANVVITPVDAGHVSVKLRKR